MSQKERKNTTESEAMNEHHWDGCCEHFVFGWVHILGLQENIRLKRTLRIAPSKPPWGNEWRLLLNQKLRYME